PFAGDQPQLLASKLCGAPAVDGPADLVALAAALLDLDPARRPCDDQLVRQLGAPAPSRVHAMPFVGRDHELAELRRAWVAAHDKTAKPRARGPSGVGKSALIARFASALHADGAVVLLGRCHERV